MRQPLQQERKHDTNRASSGVFSCRKEHEFWKPSPGGPERRNQQDLLLVLPDLAQCLGETHCVEPEASCVPARLCRGGPRSGSNTAGSGKIVGSKQVHLSFPELTPDQPDCLGMESPFSRGRELSWERVGCTIELPWNVGGTQRFELRLTPEDEMAGELWHAAWS